jgi:hypothetical protein
MAFWMRSSAVIVASCAATSPPPSPVPVLDVPDVASEATATTATATATAASTTTTVSTAATATATASSTIDPPTVLLVIDAWPPALIARLAREADARPVGVVALAPPRDRERDAAIKRTFGDICRLERTCGPLWGIDCHAAVDGPYYYARPRGNRIERITTCGGYCMGGRCTDCPPRAAGWTCPTY